MSDILQGQYRTHPSALFHETTSITLDDNIARKGNERVVILKAYAEGAGDMGLDATAFRDPERLTKSGLRPQSLEEWKRRAPQIGLMPRQSAYHFVAATGPLAH